MTSISMTNQSPAHQKLDSISDEERSLVHELNENTRTGEEQQEPYRPPTFSRRQIMLAQLRNFVTLLVIDVGLPMAIFYVFKIFTTEIVALICSGIPPLLRVAYVVIRYRRIDVLSVIFVLAFIISGALSAVTGDVRVVLLRESFVTLVIGFLFALTLIPITTPWFKVYPMTFLVSREMFSASPPVTWTDASGEKHSEPRADWLYNEIRTYRIFHRVLTAGWGIGLLLEFAIKAILIFTNVPTSEVVLYGNIVLIVIIVFMTVASTLIIFRIRKRLERRQNEWFTANDYTVKFNDINNASSATHNQ
ncbi:hypothetical protein K492DRAFT_156849 [Lichtheimia hyalospora FSU 10163]|nr:hypothetical protein K492DRAFT_156849 [Lichtheimia hyalospora FSU 10163]